MKPKSLLGIFVLIVTTMLSIPVSAAVVPEEKWDTMNAYLIAGAKQNDFNAIIEDGPIDYAKFEWPIGLVYGDENFYVMDGTRLRVVSDGQVSTLANIESFKDDFIAKGIKYPETFAQTIRVGNMVYKNGNVYIGALLSDAYYPKITDTKEDKVPKPFEGQSYATIWKYNVESQTFTNHFWMKSAYNSGYDGFAFHETETGLDGALYNYHGNIVYDLGYGKRLGRLYVDNLDNIYTIWSTTMYDDAAYKIDKNGKVEKLSATRSMNLLTDNDELYTGKFFHSDMVVPRGDGSYRYFNGGSGMIDFKPGELKGKLLYNSVFSRTVFDLSRPVIGPLGMICFLNDDGIRRLNFEGETVKTIWQDILTVKGTNIPNQVGKVGAYTFDREGDIVFIDWTNRQLKEVRLDLNRLR
ncbi:hypothetical protein [Paenibacillus sp. FSL H8-0034]|uniref:hypothetical protein n=1 Tax=Paenibacillus sp. FSL H8-0034 TaxID=2954671 RepID=UPI0030F75B7B